MKQATRLLADIGGTHARLAWQRHSGATFEHASVLDCARYPGLESALLEWLDQHQLPKPQSAALAVATPVQGDLIRFTNSPWSFSIDALRLLLGVDQLRVLNDFTALAMALPMLLPSELRQIGGAKQKPFANQAPVGLIGAGTGLGVSGLLRGDDGGWIPIAGEGGHVSLPVNDPREAAVLGVLHQRLGGHVSAERVLSGEGLRQLWGALHQLAQGQWPAALPEAAEISDQALRHAHPAALEVMDVFCGFLGHVAGNLALTLGATGGVFIGGGIVPRWAEAFDRSRFRACFEAKGRFSQYLAPIPVWVIDANEPPALRGAAHALDAKPAP